MSVLGVLIVLDCVVVELTETVNVVDVIVDTVDIIALIEAGLTVRMRLISLIRLFISL